MTAWTISESTAHVERRIITACIISDEALRSIILIGRPQFFSTIFTRTIFEWIIAYFHKYQQAPQAEIQTIYEAYRRAGLDPEVSLLISQFLASISREYAEDQEGFNSQYYADLAENYFRERSLVLLKEDLEYHIDSGNFLAAEAKVAEHRQPGRAVTLGMEPFMEMEVVRAAFEATDGLFTLPGALGQLIGPFERETAWGVAGAFKIGKTRLTKYIALQALYKGLNVAWFSLEMGRKRTVRMFMQGICSMPLRPPQDGRLLWPVWDCTLNQMDTCVRPERINTAALVLDAKGLPVYSEAPSGYRPCAVCRGASVVWQPESWLEWRECSALTWREAWRKAEALQAMLMGARLKVQCWPRFAASSDDARSCLQIWEHMDGFVPDVVVIDSVDIFSDAGTDRHALNAVRQRVVGWAQERHALLISPFQAGGKEAMERTTHRRSDVGEDSRILGHVDGLLHVNATDRERFFRRARVMVGTHRDEASSMGNQVVILQQLACGQAVLGSFFKGQDT